MKRIIACSLFVFLGINCFSLQTPQASAAPKCATKVCVKVFTDPKTGQVIIQAYQNRPGASKKPVTPKTAIPVTPKPKPTRTWKARPYVYRPYTPRPKPTSKPVTAISLSDQLTQLIPSKEIYYQPSGKVLTQVPVNFWTTTSATFTTSVVILQVPVSVNLTPTFTWDFGDGTSLVTTDRGAVYPNGNILHTYKKAGSYNASLTVSWSGTWMADALSYPVLGGAIVQQMHATILVTPAPTKYTQ